MKKLLKLTALVAIASAALYCLSGCGDATVISAEVLEKSFIPSQTGVGVGVTSSGNTVVTTTSESERWRIIAKSGDDVFAFSVSPEQWADIEKGDEISVSCAWYGRSLVQ